MRSLSGVEVEGARREQQLGAEVLALHVHDRRRLCYRAIKGSKSSVAWVTARPSPFPQPRQYQTRQYRSRQHSQMRPLNSNSLPHDPDQRLHFLQIVRGVHHRMSTHCLAHALPRLLQGDRAGRQLVQAQAQAQALPGRSSHWRKRAPVRIWICFKGWEMSWHPRKSIVASTDSCRTVLPADASPAADDLPATELEPCALATWRL
jgi:hypothetical protein